jgi:hypothetical protein
MGCASCQSEKLAEFTAEMMIHFSGLSNIEHPGIAVTPKVSVCLDCGFSRFTMSEIELKRLAKRTATRDR